MPMLTITFHSRVLPAYLCEFVGTRPTFSVLGNEELCQHTFSVLGNQELCLFSWVSPHSSLSLCLLELNPTFLSSGTKNYANTRFSALGDQELCPFSWVSPPSSLSLCVCWDSSHVFCPQEPRTMPTHVFCPREPRTMPTHVFCPREPRTMPLLLGFASYEKLGVSQGVL